MSVSAANFVLPDSELSWKLWRNLTSGKGEALDSPAECRQSSRPIVIGLPATACRTLGMILPAADSNVLRSMIEAQLEKRGIHVVREPTPNFAWHVLSQAGGQAYISVDVLSHPFPAELALNHAANYTPALRLVSLPPNDLVVIEEQGLLVLAANHAGKLWHSHVLGYAEMPVADLAREIEVAKLALEAQEGFGVVRGATLIGERLSLLKGEIRKHIAMELDSQPGLAANRLLNLSALPKLLPEQVFQAKKSRENRRRLASILVLTGVLYSLLFAAGWWYLHDLEKQAAALENQASVTRAPAAEVKTAAQRWRAMGPAIDVQRYPMVQLSHITGLMPPSGLVVKRFESKTDVIELRGEARDLQTAEQFLEDLQKHPKLSRFTWEMPTPDMKNKIANFKIQGKLAEGS
jgi:hypothetical protein